VLDQFIIEDPELVLIVMHDIKRMILDLITRKAMNIQELREATNVNPGTIKRNLDDLEKNHLIFVADTKWNEYHIKMKYYHAIAKKFIINFQIPQKDD
jgi:DNA-binding PadR family transcriptional regulator